MSDKDWDCMDRMSEESHGSGWLDCVVLLCIALLIGGAIYGVYRYFTQ